MKKRHSITIIGLVNDSKKLFGPSRIIYNQIKYLQKDNNVTFINTNTNNYLEKFTLIIKICLRILFKKDEIVNIHTFGYFLPYFVLKLSKFNKKNKYILTVHGLTTVESNIRNSSLTSKQKYFEKEIISNFPYIFTVSNKLKYSIKQLYHRADNVFTVYNGIDNSTISVKNKTKKEFKKIDLITAGGIDPLKGIFEMLSLVKFLNSKLSIPVFLHIYGRVVDSDTYEKYLEMLKSSDVCDFVIYEDSVEHDLLLKKYNEYDFCITLTKYDTFNLTILESLSVGTPVIVSSNAGITEILNESCSCIVDLCNDYENDILNYLDQMINTPKLYNISSEKSFDLAKQYSSEKMNEHLMNLIETRVIG